MQFSRHLNQLERSCRLASEMLASNLVPPLQQTSVREVLVFRRFILQIVFLLAGAFVLPLPLCAQLQLGDNFHMNLNGTLGAGYGGSYGNLTPSDHSISLGGSAAAMGYYFNPNFLSFSVTPYYNQSRDNSTSTSITDSSGVAVSSSLFSGSPFPLSISYSKEFNSEGSYAVPGVANYVSHGDSQGFGITWGEHLEGMPSLQVGFQVAGNQGSLFGTTKELSASNKSLSLSSTYSLLGFRLGGSFAWSDNSAQYPNLAVAGQPAESNSGSGYGYGFNIAHRIPFWNGSWGAGFSSTSETSGSSIAKTTESFDNFTSQANFQPLKPMHLTLNVLYTNNLSGEIDEVVLAAGGTIPQSNPSSSSNSLQMTANADYQLTPNVSLRGEADRTKQTYAGQVIEDEYYTASATYFHGLLGGTFGAGVSVGENKAAGSSGGSLAFSGTASYNRRIGRWNMSASAAYSQNNTTVLATFMSSTYSYSASVRRRWKRLTWSLGAGLSGTGLTATPDTAARSENLGMGLSIGSKIHLNGTYAKSDGNGIATETGVIASPIPAPLLPASSLILYGGDSYSASVGFTPTARLSFSAAYSKALSNTTITGASATDSTNQFNSIVQYQFRKMFLTGGYSRVVQGFSASGTLPQNFSNFYIGISRWFNFF